MENELDTNVTLTTPELLDQARQANNRKPKRTGLDRAVERRRHLCDITTGIWFEAQRRGESHDWILEQIKTRVHGHRHWAKLPSWAKMSINEAGFTMLSAAQGWMLANVWIFEGTVYGNDWDKLPEFVRVEIRADKLRMCTIWAEPSTRFTDKPASQVKFFSHYKAERQQFCPICNLTGTNCTGKQIIYESFDAFNRNSGYMGDMIRSSIAEARKNMAELKETVIRGCNNARTN